MHLEEKIIASGLMFIFAMVVWFTSHPKGMKGIANPSHWWWGAANFLFNKNGTWGLSFWIFQIFGQIKNDRQYGHITTLVEQTA